MESFPVYQMDNLKRFSKPTISFNQMIKIEKYKITIKAVEQTKEEKIAKLKRLYEKEDNWHNKGSIDSYCLRNWGFRMYDLIEEDLKDKPE